MLYNTNKPDKIAVLIYADCIFLYQNNSSLITVANHKHVTKIID